MTVFLRYTAAYFMLGTAVNLFVRGELYTSSVRAILRSNSFLGHAERGALIFVVFLGVAIYISPTFRDFLTRFRNAALGVVLCCIFLGTFGTMKTALPFIVERFGHAHFFADPYLAELDRILHFGIDPWRIAHGFTQALGLDNFANQAGYVYGIMWAIPAFYLPAIMLLMGEDRRNFVHFVSLYVFAWVVLGNFVALLGSSSGPVFYDRVFVSDRFAELHPAMIAGGLQGSFFELVQDFLWTAYAERMQTVGSGISAFPSLHLASITIFALYLQEKGRVPAVLGWTFVLAILFISVWNGYHYAIDGYFSIAVMWGLHRYLRGRTAREDRQVVIEPDTPATPTATPAE